MFHQRYTINEQKLSQITRAYAKNNPYALMDDTEVMRLLLGDWHNEATHQAWLNTASVGEIVGWIHSLSTEDTVTA